MKLVQHWKTITKHKRIVMQECFSVGLYWQGLTHDLSKFMPTEFLVGIKYWQGNRSPNTAERDAIGYSSAWLHHKGRNKHHFEYWIDYSSRFTGNVMIPAPMPRRYVVEMFMDRLAASKVYNGDNYTDGDALAYYEKGNAGKLMHPKTRYLLEKLLKMNADEGEEKTFQYIREHVLKKKKGISKND